MSKDTRRSAWLASYNHKPTFFSPEIAFKVTTHSHFTVEKFSLARVFLFFTVLLKSNSATTTSINNFMEINLLMKVASIHKLVCEQKKKSKIKPCKQKHQALCSSTKYIDCYSNKSESIQDKSMAKCIYTKK